MRSNLRRRTGEKERKKLRSRNKLVSDLQVGLDARFLTRNRFFQVNLNQKWVFLTENRMETKHRKF